MKKVALAVAVFMLTGCPRTELVKPGATQEDFNRDMAECRYEADKALAYIRDGLERALRASDMVVDCMKLKGYSES